MRLTASAFSAAAAAAATVPLATRTELAGHVEGHEQRADAREHGGPGRRVELAPGLNLQRLAEALGVSSRSMLNAPPSSNWRTKIIRCSWYAPASDVIPATTLPKAMRRRRRQRTERGRGLSAAQPRQPPRDRRRVRIEP